MSELSKNQLTTENNNSFPNNNTGYITPTLLRTFNQNMIDSLVDEQTYTTDSGSFNARINALDPSGSAQALIALEQATASLNAYTQSQNSFNSSATASIVALQNWSSSLDATYATDAQLSASVSALSSSVTVTTNGLSSSIGILDSEVNALQQFSSSLDTTFATDAQLSASASTLQNNINSLSQSVAVTDLAQSQSIAALQQFSSSLDSTFATDAQLSASASTLQNNINTKLDSASFNTYTQSNDAKVNSLISETGSYATLTELNLSSSTLQSNINAVNISLNQISSTISGSATTASNTFIGNQIVSGNVNIAGNITAVSASFTYITTVFETASVIFSSGSNQLGDELSDVQTLSGSVKVQGELLVNGVSVQTSSFDASGYLLTSSFNQYTESAASGVSASINSATQSLSSSIAVTTNNLDLEVNQKLDSSSFNSYTQSNDTKVNSLINQTGSYAISSSVAATFDAFSSSISLTYATETELSASASTLQNGINSKVENSTFNTYTSSQNSINQGLSAAIATKLNITTFNSYTSSNDSKVNSLIAATGSYITSAQTSSMTVLSASYSETASYALNTQNIDTGSLVTTASFNAYTQSASTNVSESINSATQSLSSSIAVTTNNLDLEVNGKLDSSSFNTYTQSNDSKVNSLISATGSYITSAQTSSMSVLSSSFAVTASFAENVTPTDVSMFVSQSTFNAYTQSNNSVVNALVSATSSYAISSSVAAIDAAQDGQINSLIAATSSYVTESETGSFATTGSNIFRGNQTISGSLLISGNITATSASFQYVQTIFETASTIYSSGSNQFGDEASDVQTLYGSVNAVNRFTASGLNYPTADNGDKSFLQTDGNGNLSLQYVDTIFEAFYAVESVPKGTPLYFSGSQGANPRAFAADASDPTKMPVVVVANDNLTAGNTYEGIVLGLIEGLNLTGFTAGQSVYVAEGGGYSTSLPSGSNSITQLLGVITKGGNGGKGLVLNPGPAQLPGLVDGYLWVGNTSNQPVAVSTSSIQTDVSGYTTTASFNSYTQSNNSRVDSLIAATSSYITSAQTSSMSVLSSSYAVTASFALNATVDRNGLITTGSSSETQAITGSLLVSGGFNAKVAFPSLNVTNNILQSTGSIVVSQDIVRQGGGPTDVTAIRLQALSGSVMSGDTLQSTVTAQNNLNTSTFLSASSIASIQALWATGSMAGRVGYTAGLTATAQSGSSISVLSGNTIRLGTSVSNVISSTGSFGPMVLVGNLNEPVFAIRSGSFEVTTPQGSGSFYTNLPITSSGMRLNGLARFSGIEVIALGGAAGSGSIFVENAITASVISASNMYADTVFANVFNGTASFATNAGTAQTASYVLNAVSASYSTQALTASFALNVQNINTSSLATTGSNTFRDTQYIISGAISGTFVDNAGSIYTQSNAVRHIVNLGSSSYSNIGVPDANTLYVITGDEQYVLIQQTASFATTGSNRFNGNQTITGSLTLSSSAAIELNVIGNTLLTGSVQGNVSSITISSTTASIDCNLGNFFTLALANGTNHISASNIRPGQTINVRVTTQSGNAVTCSSVIKQPSGSLYTPTNGSGTDILTLIAYDNTTLFMASVKNMI